ncbi:MAG: hypothetical protein ABI743_06535 [bacterium]
MAGVFEPQHDESLWRSLDGDLSPSEEAALAGAVAADPSLARRQALLRDTKTALGTIATEPAPDRLWAGVVAALPKTTQEPVTPAKTIRVAPLSRYALVAVFLLSLVAGGFWWITPKTHEDAMAREHLAAAHGTLTGWSAMEASTISAPWTLRAGLTLVSSTLHLTEERPCQIKDCPATQYFGEVAGTAVSLFELHEPEHLALRQTCPIPGGQAYGIGHQPDGGTIVNLVSWNHGDEAWVLASEMAAEDLIKLIEAPAPAVAWLDRAMIGAEGRR